MIKKKEDVSGWVALIFIVIIIVSAVAIEWYRMHRVMEIYAPFFEVMEKLNENPAALDNIRGCTLPTTSK